MHMVPKDKERAANRVRERGRERERERKRESGSLGCIWSLRIRREQQQFGMTLLREKDHKCFFSSSLLF